MKPTIQISKECNLESWQITKTAVKNGIIPTKIKRVNFYDKYQEDLLHEILFFERKIDYVIYESKINKL